jgi:aspartyl-tRNA(Asn)/glutamyl-tRNA(Gln) amidotransferase subunit A
MPLSPSLDHVGPLARSVADAAILLGLIAGRDSLDPTSSLRPVEDFRGALRKPPRKFRLGRPREHYWEKLDAEVRRATETAVRAMEKRGAVVREVSLPHLKGSLDAATDISLAEALHVHEAAGYFPARAAEYGEEVRQRIDAGGNVPATRYLAGFDVRKQLLAEFDAAFQNVDAIVAPTVPVPAPNPCRLMANKLACVRRLSDIAGRPISRDSPRFPSPADLRAMACQSVCS